MTANESNGGTEQPAAEPEAPAATELQAAPQPAAVARVQRMPLVMTAPQPATGSGRDVTGTPPGGKINGILTEKFHRRHGYLQLVAKTLYRLTVSFTPRRPLIRGNSLVE